MKHAQPIQTVVSCGVAHELAPEQIHQAFHQLFEAMKTPDPNNPDLWVVHLGPHKLWGVLDHGAGLDGQDLLTLLFPHEY